MNNMRSRQQETSAHQQVKDLYKTWFYKGLFSESFNFYPYEENNAKTAYIQ